MNCYACNTDVDKLLERIAELEQQKQVLIEQHDMWRQQWSELTQSLDIRDLEQQANACTDLIGMWKAMKSHHLTIADLQRRSEYLLEQAAKLKEQG